MEERRAWEKTGDVDGQASALAPTRTPAGGAPDPDVRFRGYQRLTVRQRKRWLELLLSFEMRNTYDVYDETQMPVLRVREEGAGILQFLKRVFMGSFRPFRAGVVELGSERLVLALRRPFRFFFHRLEVASGSGQRLGAIQRRWAWLRRIYHIEDPTGAVLAQLFGPILRPWTFQILVDGEILGTIRKRWSGLLKEAFTDADNFGVEIGKIESARLKTLAFAATVLIDVVHFERSKG